MSRAAGFVVFRRLENAPVEFLLLKASYGTKHWTPPKGHVDPGESDFETALRETVEESGLEAKHLEQVKDFKVELKYDVPGRGKNAGKIVPKTVIYFLAKLIDPEKVEVKLSEEHTDFIWAELDKACEISEYEEAKMLLRKCDEAIKIHM